MRYDFRLAILLACSLWVSIGFAQSGKYTAFMAKDGLPSSCVYRTLEDDKGFLWIATNAGVARFDGKYFQVFTTRDGLPDNEATSFVKETNGRIWVECFNQMPAYFDEVQNRFVTPVTDKKTAARFAYIGTLRALPNGGISYGISSDSRGWEIVVFKGAKQKRGPVAKNLYAPYIVEEYPDGSILETSGSHDIGFNAYQVRFLHIKGEKTLDSIRFLQAISTEFKRLFPEGMKSDNGNLYLGFRYFNTLYIYTDIQTNPIRLKISSVQIPEPYVNYFLTPNRIAFIGESGKIYIYDKHTLQPVHTISNDYLTNAYFNDSKGNEWVATIDKGLVLYRNQPLQSLEMPEHFSNTNFMSVTRKKDGTVLAGNYYGEVLEIKNGKSVVHKVINRSPARIRKILAVGDAVYTFSEEGVYYNFKTRIPTAKQGSSFSKMAVVCNDTTILIDASGKLTRLNTRTNKTHDLNSRRLKISTLAKAAGDWVYLGSGNGLYKYNYNTNSDYIPLAKTDPVLGKSVSGLCYTPDDLLWVLQSDNTIAVLKNDKVVSAFRLNNELINGFGKHIIGGKSGRMWMASSNGIGIIDYEWKNDKFVYTTRSLSDKNGLASNEIEEIFYQNGAIYVATSNGITVVPEDYIAPKADIPTYLTRMAVNQEERVISDNYQLEYGQQNLQMQFAGVALSGYFKHFQYQLDKSGNWIKLDQNILTVQLSTGTHSLKVRAVDVNGNISNKILTLRFDVAIPFWQNIWFLVVCGALAQILLFYAISRYYKQKREAKLAQKIAGVQTAAIEQQAFTSLMNPHFMFNALNSIQHYINLQDRKNANRYLSDFASLIRKNFDAAQQSFIPLEEEIENIKIYLNLELMRFNDRFRFTVQVDDGLEAEDWMIPTMILQPLLENALLHGIMPSTLRGEIAVQFKPQDQDLLIIITDNGIGIANSLAIKGHSIHKSRGTELIGKRIKALSHFGAKPMTIMMEPVFESNTNPGNRVTLLIPETLYEAWRCAKHQ